MMFRWLLSTICAVVLDFISSPALAFPEKELLREVSKLDFFSADTWLQKHQVQRITKWKSFADAIDKNRVRFIGLEPGELPIFETGFLGAYFMKNPHYKKSYLFTQSLQGSMRNFDITCFVQQPDGRYKRKFVFLEDTRILEYHGFPAFIVPSQTLEGKSWRLLKLRNDYLHDVRRFSFPDTRIYRVARLPNPELVKSLGIVDLWKIKESSFKTQRTDPAGSTNPQWRALDAIPRPTGTISEFWWEAPTDEALRNAIVFKRKRWENQGGSMPTYVETWIYNRSGRTILHYRSDMWRQHYLHSYLVTGKRYLVLVKDFLGPTQPKTEVEVHLLTDEMLKLVTSYEAQKLPPVARF